MEKPTKSISALLLEKGGTYEKHLSPPARGRRRAAAGRCGAVPARSRPRPAAAAEPPGAAVMGWGRAVCALLAAGLLAAGAFPQTNIKISQGECKAPGGDVTPHRPCRVGMAS